VHQSIFLWKLQRDISTSRAYTKNGCLQKLFSIQIKCKASSMKTRKGPSRSGERNLSLSLYSISGSCTCFCLSADNSVQCFRVRHSLSHDWTLLVHLFQSCRTVPSLSFYTKTYSTRWSVSILFCHCWSTLCSVFHRLLR
jgi:hypothetical protein